VIKYWRVSHGAQVVRNLTMSRESRKRRKRSEAKVTGPGSIPGDFDARSRGRITLKFNFAEGGGHLDKITYERSGGATDEEVNALVKEYFSRIRHIGRVEIEALLSEVSQIYDATRERVRKSRTLLDEPPE